MVSKMSQKLVEEEFFDDWVQNKKIEKKKEILDHEPIVFSLTEFSKNGGCNYCLHGNCTTHYGEKAKDIHPLIKSVVKNPSKIIGNIPKILKDNGFDTENKHIHVNTCIWNYTHSDCKNCKEGRSNYVKFTDSKGRHQELKFCFPILKKNSNVIPIGFHWDIELLIEKNEITDYKIHPFDGFKNQKINKNSDSNNIKSIDIQDTIEEPIKDDIDQKPVELKKTGTVWDNKINFFEDTEIKEKKEEIKLNENKTPDCTEDNNSQINKLLRENKLLIKENNDQKEAIKGLKAVINLDNTKNLPNDSKNNELLSKKIDELTNQNNVLLKNNKELKQDILRMKDEINKMKNSKLTNKDIDYIKEQAIKSVKNYSNIIFESVMRTHYE